MVSEQEWKDFACECVRLAGLTDDQEIRNHLLELTRRRWMDRHERYSGSQSRNVIDFSWRARRR
jgi:hypothetical protein